jgi:hypothetical protein
MVTGKALGQKNLKTNPLIHEPFCPMWIKLLSLKLCPEMVDLRASSDQPTSFILT